MIFLPPAFLNIVCHVESHSLQSPDQMPKTPRLLRILLLNYAPFTDWSCCGTRGRAPNCNGLSKERGECLMSQECSVTWKTRTHIDGWISQKDVEIMLTQGRCMLADGVQMRPKPFFTLSPCSTALPHVSGFPHHPLNAECSQSHRHLCGISGQNISDPSVPPLPLSSQLSFRLKTMSRWLLG